MELKPQQPLFAALGISTAQATLARFLLPEPLLILYNLSSSKKRPSEFATDCETSRLVPLLEQSKRLQ